MGRGHCVRGIGGGRALRAVVALGSLVLLAACSGCGFASAYNANVDTLGVLLHDGFLDVQVHHSPEFPSASQSVTVSVVTSGSKAQADVASSSAEGDPAPVIARDVWTTFPYHFDSLTATVVGNPPVAFTATELRSMFGDRPARLESATLAHVVSTGWDEVYAALAVIILVVLVDIARVTVRHHRIHRDRVAEVALSDGHMHLSQHELDLWSGHGSSAGGAAPAGAGAHPQFAGAGAHPQFAGAGAHPQFAGAGAHPQFVGAGLHAPTGAARHTEAPLPPVPHVENPWSGHAPVAPALALPAHSGATPPAHPGAYPPAYRSANRPAYPPAYPPPAPPHPGPPPVST